MGNTRIKEKQIYNEALPFKVVKKGWYTGICTLQEVEGCKGFVLEPHQSIEPSTSLATNFFSMELLKVNPDDSKELAKFMGRYGLVDCPYRERSVPAFDYGADSVLLPAIKKTDTVRDCLLKEHNKKMFLAIQDKSRDSWPANSNFFAPLPQHFVSYDEAVAVVRLLQDIVNGLFSRLDGNGWEDSHLLGFVSANVGNYNQIEITELKNASITVKEGDVLLEAIPLGFLTCAISNQIIETIADEAAWYKCIADDCGHWFKWKRATDAPRGNSEYCSARCTERMRKRRQRHPEQTDTST